jgi:hypothetical protein
MPANSRPRIATWLGEFFREAAVLIAVLAPMELLVQNGFLTLRQSGFIVVLTASCAGVGFYLGLKGHAGQTVDE